jgi:YVTN family beta-propeller protein
MRHALPYILFSLSCLLLPLPNGGGGDIRPPARARFRSPIDIALLDNGRLVLVANHGSNSVSLVDLDGGKVLAESACGGKPAAVVASPDGKMAVVGNLGSGTLTLFSLAKDALVKTREVPFGGWPRALVFSHDGASLFAALAGRDEIVELDCAAGKITRRWAAPREPRSLALSADGQWLAAASSRSAQVRCWNVHSGKLHWERDIGEAFNLRGLCFTPENDAVICAHSVRRDFPVTKDNIEKGWVIDSRLTRLALAAEHVPPSWQVALDPAGRAVSDPYGVAVSPSGRWLVFTSSGTHELVVLAASAVPWNGGDPGDVLNSELLKSDNFRRIELGGRPMALAFRGRSNTAIVANYLLDAIQVMDIAAGKLLRTISLGATPAPDLARQGEALFYDARWSHNQWFSCHTCHVDGHTCCLNFDTLNDDTYGTPKLTPSLFNVTRTGPWTWHGRQQDLGAGVAKSFMTTLHGPRPTEHETAAMLAFLDTLKPPPHPRAERTGGENAAVRRGEAVFKDKARCNRCHRPPYYTSPGAYDVKLEAEGSPYKLWNPPSLLGLHDRGPYLHDGRAKTLKEVLEKHHTPDMLGGPELTDEEQHDLRAFLLSL